MLPATGLVWAQTANECFTVESYPHLIEDTEGRTPLTCHMIYARPFPASRKEDNDLRIVQLERHHQSSCPRCVSRRIPGKSCTRKSLIIYSLQSSVLGILIDRHDAAQGIFISTAYDGMESREWSIGISPVPDRVGYPRSLHPASRKDINMLLYGNG